MNSMKTSNVKNFDQANYADLSGRSQVQILYRVFIQSCQNIPYCQRSILVTEHERSLDSLLTVRGILTGLLRFASNIWTRDLVGC